jgi:hypothetical protein
MSFRLGTNETSIILKVPHAFSEAGVYEFPFSGNIVEFTVPASGIYKIEAWGARGGSGSPTTGPLGAYSKSYVSLNKSDTIKILVGEKGYPGYSGNPDCAGGSGGTFIAKGSEPLCVAGGGGSFSFRASVNSAVQPYACGQATQLSVNLGSGQVSLKMGGKGAGDAAGGAGFTGNGIDGSSYGKGGISFLNGGARQTQGTTGSYGYGGFGGGGSRSGSCGVAAGSGGYTGGSAGGLEQQGGGGGSYFVGNFSGETSSAISGCDSRIPPNPGSNGNGFAVLTLLESFSDAVQEKKLSCYCHCYQVRFLWSLYLTLLSQ